jgi:adenine-specific DNA methylase
VTIRKKLIEVALPLEAINVASAREKSIRHGHPSTLHLWWARRPLAAPRAVMKTSLMEDKVNVPTPRARVQTGRLRFIEVKGRRSRAQTVTITRNEILVGLNQPEQFILAVVEIEDGQAKPSRYVRQPFHKEPDFGITSINYNLQELLKQATLPG